MIPDHDLIKQIGHGSYGEVWLARNATGSYRAIKVVYRHTFEADKPYEREFTGIKEFEPISRSHPAQIDILHVGRNDEAGYFYYVMELADDESAELGTEAIARQTVAGQPPTDSRQTATESTIARAIHPETYEPKTLRSVLRKRGRLPVEECLQIATSLAEALEHLHAHGLVHRDIKPSNVIFVNGRPKLADIGLVARVDATLSFVGTEGFLPPEGPGKPQADIFSLGKVLYEMATGKDRNDFSQPPVGIEQAEDHEAFLEFNEIILKACEHSQDRRYQTATELHQELLLLKAGKSVRRLHSFESRLSLLKRIAASFLVLALIAVAATVYQRAQTREARRLAAKNLELAKSEAAQRQRAEAAVRRHELQEIEQMFETDKTSEALALLAQRARAHPNDSFAARRLLSALTYRNFALPVVEMHQESRGQNDLSAGIAGEDISPDSQILATITRGGALSLWNLRTGERLAKKQCGNFDLFHSHYFLSVQFNHDGTRLVTPGGREMAARVWKVDRGLELALDIERPDQIEEFYNAQFSPDGKRVAAVDRAGRGFIWDATTGEELVAFGEDQGRQVLHAACRFTQDGEQVITSLYGNPAIRGVKVWNSKTGALMNHLDDSDYVGGQNVLSKSTFSLDPAGSRMVYLSGSGRIHMWDYVHDTAVMAREKHAGSLRSVAFSPDGRLVATGGDDQTVRLWEVRADELRLLRELHHTGRVISLAFSPDGQRLASGSMNGSIRFWETDSGRPAGEPLQGASPYIKFTLDGKRLLSVGGSSAWIWDVRSGAARPNLIVHRAKGDVLPGGVKSVQFSPDGSHLVTSLGSPVWRPSPGSWTPSQRKLWSQVWDSATGNPLSPPIEKIHSQTTIAITPDGSRALTALDKGFALWDPRDGTVLHQVEGIGHDARLMALSPNGRWALTADLMGHGVVWDLESERKLWKPSEDGPLLAASFSPDSSRVFIVTLRKTPEEEIGVGTVRRSENGERLLSFQRSLVSSPSNWFQGQAHWSPDQRLLAFAHGWACWFYDAESGEAIAGGTFHHHNVIGSSGFSADGRYFVTASADQTARIWDLKGWKQAAPDLRHNDVVAAAVFSKNGREVATASFDRSARLWDRETGLPLPERFPHPDQVWAVDIDPEGKWLATGCRDGAARIWELPQAEATVPDWLLDLAESLGGLEVGPSGSLDQVPDPRVILALKQWLNSEPADTDDEYVRWGRWFFADRETRAVSPSAKVGMEDYQRRLAQLKSARR